MYPYPQQAYAPHAQPLAPAQGGWWPQPAGYPQQPIPPMAYPQPHPMQPMAPAGMVHGMMPAGYAQAMPYAPPAMYPAPVAPMPMQHFVPYQPPTQVQVQAYPVPYPVPVMMPYPAHAGTVIQHEAPRAAAPEMRETAQPAAAAGPAPEATAEAVSALDEVRAQLRAFAGSLDALRSARSA